MNFHFLTMLNEVTDFAAFENSYFVIHKGIQLSCTTADNCLNLYNEGLQISNMTIDERGFFWCTHALEKPFSLWGEVSQLEVKKVDFLIKEIHPPFFYCSQNGMGKKIDFHGKEIWKSSIKFIVANYDTLVYVRNSKASILALNAITGDIVWQYSLPEIEVYYDGERVENIQISNILGVYDNVLWIVLSTGFFVGVNAESGDQKYLIKMPSNSPEDWKRKESFAEAKKSVLSKEQGMIFGVDYRTYWELDLKAPEQTYKYYNFEINNHLQSGSILATLPQPLSWQGDEIVIAQQEFGQQPSYVGIYNRKSRSITWNSHELGETGVFAGLRKVQLYGNKLYVLDAAGILHVFEREN